MGDREIIASNEIHIRSKDCVAITDTITTNFYLTLEIPISCYNDEMIVVSLATAEIPYTFFGVNTTNNFLEFEEYDYNNPVYSNPRTSISVQITSGNYTIYQLKEEVITQMNNNSVFSSPYTSTYDDITNTLTIIITGNNIGCKLLCDTGTNKEKRIFRQLGFSSIDFLFNTSIFSDGNVDLATIHSLYLRTDLGLSNSFSSATKNLTNILSKIPINCDALEMIYFNPTDRSGYNVLQQNYIRNMNISLTDQNDNIIDLGKNINWELSLVFDIVKRPKRTYIAYNTIDFNEKITVKEIPKTNKTSINELYNKPIKDLELNKKIFKNDVNEIENKINNL